MPTGDIPTVDYYKEMIRHRFVLAPRGGAVDTHRFYEALKARSIPIVKSTNTAFDIIYKSFPCIVLNDWNELLNFKCGRTELLNMVEKIDELHEKTNSLRINADNLTSVFI